jgi:hypothetical protein
MIYSSSRYSESTKKVADQKLFKKIGQEQREENRKD